MCFFPRAKQFLELAKGSANTGALDDDRAVIAVSTHFFQNALTRNLWACQKECSKYRAAKKRRGEHHISGKSGPWQVSLARYDVLKREHVFFEAKSQDKPLPRVSFGMAASRKVGL